MDGERQESLQTCTVTVTPVSMYPKLDGFINSFFRPSERFNYA